MSEAMIDCPVCKGVCGVEVSINMDESGEPESVSYAADWFDCDFCNATGKVTQDEANRAFANPALYGITAPAG